MADAPVMPHPAGKATDDRENDILRHGLSGGMKVAAKGLPDQVKQ